MVEYSVVVGVPGRYFACPYGMGTLSSDSCSRSYQMSMSPIGLREGRRVTCRACPIGASHAGVPSDVASASQFLGLGYCSRCVGDARRLIRGSICISCYNREREVLIGKNAKGSRPIYGKAVSSRTLSCVFDGRKVVQVRRMDKVTSRLEAFLSILRTESKAVCLGWVGLPVRKEYSI